MNRDRRPALDGVRGIAILAVMANHTDGPIGKGGYLGVDLFFVLSGYLITTILLRERDRSERISLGRFYARRGLRLYPALVAACLIELAFAGHLGFAGRGEALRGSGSTLAYLTDIGIQLHWACVDDFFPTWSLAVEEHFYLVWPALLVACVVRGRERWLPWFAGAGLVGSLLALAVMPHLGIDNVAYRPDARGGGLLIGCLVALALRRRPVTLRPWLAWAALAVVLVLVLAGESAGLDTGKARTLMVVAWVATAVMVLELAVHTDRAFARALSWRPLAYIGLISYGLYLYHVLIYRAVGHWLNLSRTPESAIAIALSFAAAAVSYRWLESPFLRVKKRYSSEGRLDDENRPAPAESRDGPVRGTVRG